MSTALHDFIKEQFQDDKEVFEVAQYCISSLQISDELLRAIITGTNVKNIDPSLIVMSRRFDWSLTNNQFYAKYFAPIRTHLMLDDIKLSTSKMFIQMGEKNNDKHLMMVAKSLLLSRLDVLTIIMFFYKGVEEAEKFDSKVRTLLRLSPAHVEYFKGQGV